MAIYLSIEIDNKKIKIVEGSKKGGSLSVCKYMSINNDYGFVDGKITDLEYLAKVINDRLIKNNIKSKKVFFIIKDNILIRKITLPLLKKNSEILSMLEIELGQITTADLSKYRITYEIVNTIEKNKAVYAEYIVYCIPLSIDHQYVELAGKLKLKLVEIKALPQYLNEIYHNKIAVNNSILNQKEIVLFLEIKEGAISFSAMKSGYCDFHINLKFHDEAYIFDMVAEPNSPYMNTVIPSENPSGDHDILKEIVKAIRYYYTVDKVREINKIYIYGNYELDELNSLIKRKLNIYTEVVENSNYFNTILPLLSTKNKKNSLINSKGSFNYFYGAIPLSIIALLAILYGFTNSQRELRDEIKAMNTYVLNESNKEINDEIESVKRDIQFLEKYLGQINILKLQIEENDYVNSDLIKNIMTFIPVNTRVTSIYSDKTSIQLQCNSPNMKEVTLFTSNLKEIEEIDSIHIPAIHSKTGQSFSYSIIVQLKDVNEGVEE